MKALTLLAFVLISSAAICQDTLNIYYDASWKETKPESAVFHRKKFRVGETWGVIDYHKSGVVQMTGTFTDDSCKKKEGEFIWYDEKGNRTSLSNYKSGELDGRAIFYFDGKISQEGSYKMGKSDGDWTGYYAGGKISAKAHYEKGKQVSGEYYNEDGTVNKKMDVFERESEFPGEAGALNQYLSGNLRYPAKAVKNHVEGTVLVQFVIDKEGRVTDIIVLKSVDEDLDKEAVRVISRMPKWTPAIQAGKFVKSYKKIPIVFRF